jgi:hypothetical protein
MNNVFCSFNIKVLGLFAKGYQEMLKQYFYFVYFYCLIEHCEFSVKVLCFHTDQTLANIDLLFK